MFKLRYYLVFGLSGLSVFLLLFLIFADIPVMRQQVSVILPKEKFLN